MSKSLAYTRVWLTGASSGIGRAVAIELAARGCRLAISARSREGLEETARLAGPNCLAVIPADLSRRDANLAAAQSAAEALGGIDLVLLNAGTCEYVDAKDFRSDLFERTMQTNFMGTVYGIEAALPHLRKSTRPHLVGMSSTAAYAGLPRAEAYGASKAAIKYLLESLRIDLRAEGIPVSVICPGFVQTPLTDKNDFPMPMRITAERAARYIADGIARRDYEIHFPPAFSRFLKLLALLPDGLYLRLIGKAARS